jgi:Asp-tRNA(Asn)/Glu-tRNA(Gln) amidotransferase A subunit family amidase
MTAEALRSMTKDDPAAGLAALLDSGPLEEITPASRVRSRTGVGLVRLYQITIAGAAGSFRRRGLPIGIQVVGRPLAERTVPRMGLRLGMSASAERVPALRVITVG